MSQGRWQLVERGGKQVVEVVCVRCGAPFEHHRVGPKLYRERMRIPAPIVPGYECRACRLARVRIGTDDDGNRVLQLQCCDCGRFYNDRRYPIEALDTWKAQPLPSVPRCRCGQCDRDRLARYRHEVQQAAATAVQQTRTEAAERPEALLRQVGVPEHWLSWTFEACTQLPVDLLADVRAWCSKPAGALVLIGVPGAGKTAVAVAALQYVLREGLVHPSQARFIGEADWLTMLKQAIDAGLADANPRRLPANHPRTAKLLVFDDLGSTRLTDWGRGEVVRLLEDRHAAERPTVVTTNLDLDEIATVLDPRLASRLAEVDQVVRFPRVDLRRAVRQGQK